MCSPAALTLAVERGDAWGWASARTPACFAVAVVAGALFLVRERRARHPLVDPRLFRNVRYVLITGTGSLTNMGYGVTVFLATLYLQGVRGLSPLLAGTVFLAPALRLSVPVRDLRDGVGTPPAGQTQERADGAAPLWRTRTAR
ncbi:hypothetical protein [Streptomyces sp. NPDC090021]|uniref:hypothetical protein n=1 Tax=Streptomyces sp. NPDC090021 TaxID=3365919 RepID=UPI0037F2205C